ncbi:hypothetical protein VaNZ11_015990 [Volvox africanus]|uniref:Uncharacterized protein n=1 Tax=Volvox africanus TaxID=51714 RepID=A0ABQ5SM48_9CHLO|nr:hypothetical protein VaNZ11_015990 [Volvox africanus]
MEGWIDIGPLLNAARTDLQVGELLAGESFSLFEAMSALEAGNPKMDAAASPSVEHPTLEMLLADPNVAPWDLPITTLLKVLDQLLAMEASWHCGGSAMQTVYACLYMLKLDGAQQHESLASRCLYAYCRILQYDCAHVRDLVMSGAVCEEEDISMLTAGIPFEPPAGGAASALDALDTAIAATAAIVADTGSGVTAKPSPDGAVEESTSGLPTAAAAAEQQSAALWEAVSLRLRLRRAVHLGLRQAVSREPQEVITAVPHFEEVKALIPKIRQTSPLAGTGTGTGTATSTIAAPAAVTASSDPSTSATSASAATPSVAAEPTASSGNAVTSGAGSGGSSTAPGSEATAPPPPPPPSLAPGFQIDVNRHLLGPAPPRQVKVMSISESLSYMERMAEHMLAAVTVSEHVHDYRSLQMFLWVFSRLRAGAVARAAMHSLVMPERWQHASMGGVEENGATTSEQNGPAAPSNPDSGSQQYDSQLQPGSEPEKGQKGAPRPGGAGRGSGKKGGGGRKGGGGGGGGGATSSKNKQQQQSMPIWVPSKEMIAAACRVSYKTGLPTEAEMFFEQALIASSNVFQAMLMNRCRCRRRLRRCLDDWYNMYHHGLNADVVPEVREYFKSSGWRWRPLDGMPADDEQGPLSSWVEIQTTFTMLHHLLLGFELELYEPLEYDMIYWYCDFLCTNAMNVYGAILQRGPPIHPPQQPPQLQPQPHQLPAGIGRGLGGRSRGGTVGGRGRGDAAAAAAAAAMAKFEREQSQLRFEILEVEVFQQMCQGLLRLMVGLRLAGSIPEHRNPLPFNTSEQRFEQRFATFATLPKPLPLCHADYVMSTDPGSRDAAYLMGLAATSFKEARLRCGALAACAPFSDAAASWVRGLERVAATNAVVAGVLRVKVADNGSGSGSGSRKIKWESDWSLHPYFPAVTLPKTAPTSTPSSSSSSSSPSSSSTAPSVQSG